MADADACALNAFRQREQWQDLPSLSLPSTLYVIPPQRHSPVIGTLNSVIFNGFSRAIGTPYLYALTNRLYDAHLDLDESNVLHPLFYSIHTHRKIEQCHKFIHIPNLTQIFWLMCILFEL
jgi:hypothetical protein